MHYRLRSIEGGQFRLVNFASHCKAHQQPMHWLLVCLHHGSGRMSRQVPQTSCEVSVNVTPLHWCAVMIIVIGAREGAKDKVKRTSSGTRLLDF